MEASSTAVIKVKYGDMLRRFNAQVVEEKLALTLDELKHKIISLFSLSPDAELILTYVDEDGDVVHLVDADDMHDMVKQDLDPVRITVQLRSEPNVTSTPLRSHQGQQLLQNLCAGVAEILKNLQNLHAGVAGNSCDITSKALGRVIKLVDTFSKAGQQPLHNLHTEVSEIWKTCSSDLRSKGLGSSQHVAELVDTLSKVGLCYLGQFSAAQTRDHPSKNNEPENSLSKTDNNKDSDISKVNADKLKVSSNGIQGHALDNSGSVKKVQPKGDKEDVLELTDASGKCPSESRLCNLRKKSSGSQFGPKITTDPIAYQIAPNLYQFPGTSEVPPILSTSHSTPHGVGSFEKNTGQSNGADPTFFHYGVRCDGCGIHPITGPRFKSIVKLDYDLCISCFLEMGNRTDYIRMDRPAVYHNQVSANGICPYALTKPRGYSKKSYSKSCRPKLYCSFIQDVNVLDGTVMAPLTPFTKVWRMRNSGEVEWPHKTGLAFIGGNLLKDQYLVELEIPPAGIPVGQEMDVSVDFLAPEHPGMYVSYWSMVSPDGKRFGQCIWVIVEVRASGQKTPSASVTGGLNLNSPPENGHLGRNPEPVPAVEDSQTLPENNEKTDDQLIEPTVEMQPDYSQEMKFPTNDSLLVSEGASSLPFTTPVIPISAVQDNATLPMPEHLPSTEEADIGASSSVLPPTVHVVASESKIELSGRMEAEEELVNELEQMRSKEIDLNKEFLLIEDGDLDGIICDSNSDSDWDPILIELREMGFDNVETNKKLLEKNKGSITRVVMDLIAEEEDSLI